MKYKVGDKVRIVTLPNKIYTVADVYEAWEGYRLAEYPNFSCWGEDELEDAHENCGCRELDDVPAQQYEKKKRIAEVIKWLYINDRKFKSGKEWREKLIKFLEEIL